MLQTDVEIPAKSQTVVPAKYQLRGLIDDSCGNWITEAAETQDGLWVARIALPDRDENLPILILNTSGEKLWLRKGSEVAEAVVAQIEEGTVPKVVDDNFTHVDPLVEAATD